MNYTNESHMVRLDCGHAPIFHGTTPPVKGDAMLCVRCDAVRFVVDAPDEYRSQCTMCSFGKKTGRAKHDAIMGAIRHARRMSHIVKVYDGKVTVQTIGTGEKQLPVDFTGPPPY